MSEITKKVLVDQLHEYYAEEVSKADIERVLDGFVTFTHHYAKTPGTKIGLPGLGKFEGVAKPAREGRNPSTGAAIQIPASTRIKFTAAKAFKDAANGR